MLTEKENDDFCELGELLCELDELLERLAGGELTPEECAAAQVVPEEQEMKIEENERLISDAIENAVKRQKELGATDKMEEEEPWVIVGLICGLSEYYGYWGWEGIKHFDEYYPWEFWDDDEAKETLEKALLRAKLCRHETVSNNPQIDPTVKILAVPKSEAKKMFEEKRSFAELFEGGWYQSPYND